MVGSYIRKIGQKSSNSPKPNLKIGKNWSKSDPHGVWERISSERKVLHKPPRARDNEPTPNCKIPKIDPILVRTIFFFAENGDTLGCDFAK